jgi:transposase InsO family protein
LLCARLAPNVLDRTFEASAPTRKWIADFTYVWTAEGWLYLAAVIDLFSRRVVGWSMRAAVAVGHSASMRALIAWSELTGPTRSWRGNPPCLSELPFEVITGSDKP